MKAPMKTKRAPKRDLFAELSEGMTALALLRPERRKAGTKAGTKATVLGTPAVFQLARYANDRISTAACFSGQCV